MMGREPKSVVDEWIAAWKDPLHNRPFSTGMGASSVIGQQDFNSGQSATTQSGFSDPDHPSFDSSGNLWVPDFDNNRVLEFSSTAVPEFPTASLAIIALVSLAVVALVTRRFSIRLPAR